MSFWYSKSIRVICLKLGAIVLYIYILYIYIYIYIYSIYIIFHIYIYIYTYNLPNFGVQQFKDVAVTPS